MTADLGGLFRPGDPALICAIIGGVTVVKPVIIVEALSQSITVGLVDDPTKRDTLSASGQRLPGTRSHVWLKPVDGD